MLLELFFVLFPIWHDPYRGSQLPALLRYVLGRDCGDHQVRLFRPFCTVSSALETKPVRVTGEKLVRATWKTVACLCGRVRVHQIWNPCFSTELRIQSVHSSARGEFFFSRKMREKLWVGLRWQVRLSFILNAQFSTLCRRFGSYFFTARIKEVNWVEVYRIG